MNWRPRLLIRRSVTKPGTEKHVIAFGARVGYWPCLRAPFVVVEFATWRLDAWVGYPGDGRK